MGEEDGILILVKEDSGSDDQNYYTLSSAFNQTDGGLLFIANPNTTIRKVSGGLGSYIRGNDSHNLSFNLSDNGLFFIPHPILLWAYGDDGVTFHEASFNINFTMSIYQPENQTKSTLVFAIQPSLVYYIGYPISSPPIGTSSHTSSSSSSNSTVAGSHVSAQTTTVYGKINDPRNKTNRVAAEQVSLVQIDIESPPGNSSGLGSRYSVWIDYDRIEHSISVSVDATQGTPSTATANGVLKLSSIMTPFASLGFYSTMGQLLQLNAWSLTAERLPYSYSYPSQGKLKGNNGNAIILSSVLGSTAAVAITATVVYVYFNSKYRKWMKEQDKLAKTMQRLPGVPTQVDYADIRKATKNFHDTMKLGKGGVGAVYRCTLPAASLRMGRGMEVAVKKFMRDVEDRRYDDFLAEVSIINRLRHKNIVPLVGE
ncbi:unnamed protein product [Miscanthus lutarioriparius]|uniref:Protein kinase domain-containing protein n=1 Tax=Miscanthus lutarioriparius TaxID=422564 RepID=A0A811QQ99_9POAL|nr:unnamed protein product [Miscanthus lutarioriparius]